MNEYILQQKLDTLKISEDLDVLDRRFKQIDLLAEEIKVGKENLGAILDFLSKSNNIRDYIFFLEKSMKFRRVNCYDATLSLALSKFPDNIHLLFYKAIFGSDRDISENLLDKFIDSGIYKYMEFAFSAKMRLASADDALLIKSVFQDMQKKGLPIFYKKPYLELFSKLSKTGAFRRHRNYDRQVNWLLNFFDSEICIDNYAWYLRLYIRLHMYLMKEYDEKIYFRAFLQLSCEKVDIPTAQYNMLHLYNYAKINQLKIDFSFLDAETSFLMKNHPSTKMLNSSIKELNDQVATKNKRVALLISGQIRGLQKEQIKIINAKDCRVDIFVATWEKKGFKVPYNLLVDPYYRIFSRNVADVLYQNGLLGDSLYRRYPSILKTLVDGANVDINILRNHNWLDADISYVSIKKVETFSEDPRVLNNIFHAFKLKNIDNTALNNQLKMFYMNYNAYLSMCQQEFINKYKYDYILKVRPDIKMEIDLGEIIREMGDKQVVSADVMRSLDCGDRIAFGRRLIMGQYMKMFEHLHIYQNHSKDMFGCGVFKAHAPIDYQVVSSGGQIYRSAYMGVENFIDLEIIPDEKIFSLMYLDAQQRGIDCIDKSLFAQLGFDWRS